MIRELSTREIENVGGGLDLTGIPPSTNVTNQTLAGYQRQYGYVMGTYFYSSMRMYAATMSPVRAR